MEELKLHPRKGSLKKGVILVLLGWLFLSAGYPLAKIVTPLSSVGQTVFFRNWIGLICLLPFVIKDHKKVIHMNRPWLVILRGLSGMTALGLIFLALQKLSIVNTTLLSNTSPLFVPIIVRIWLKQKIDHRFWLPMVLGLLGVILVIKPDAGVFKPEAFIALLAGICLAFSAVTVKMTSGSDNPLTVLFWYMVIGVVLSLPFAIYAWHVPTIEAWLYFVLLGVTAVLGQFFFFTAFREAKVTVLAPLSYSAIIYSGIFDWIIWRDTPTLMMWFGVILICCGGIWVILLGQKKKQNSVD
ncbi:MAG: DMT family transporter [Parachlamydiales bacterium]|nr:DMT family transporter [Parachlamydiales bacterium]